MIYPLEYILLLYSDLRIGGDKMKNLKGAITCLKMTETKPNFSELGRVYGVDRRTAKKMYEGQNAKSNTRDKPSKLDPYQEIIKDKLAIPGTSMRGVYEFILDTIDKDIGTYSNFRKYVNKHEDILISKSKNAHPRFETEYGKQLQFDWKGPITLHFKSGEEHTFYVFSATLSASRMHVFLYSKFMTRETVQRCLIQVFEFLGGVPKECLTDNMSSIVNYSQHNFVPEFKTFCKDMGTVAKKCKVRHCETKGKDESCNRFVNWILPYDYELTSEEELIEKFRQITNKVNQQPNATTNMPPISLFQKEKEYLSPLPKQDILEYYVDNMIPVKVSNESLVYYKKAKYSVPPKYINQTVKLQFMENKLCIYYNKELIAIHELSNLSIQYQEQHYKECLSLSMPTKEASEIEQMAKKNLELLGRLTK